ncbi:hypothetical protein ABPG77_000436 [Micractinium sp. CCAP 211/92]
MSPLRLVVQLFCCLLVLALGSRAARGRGRAAQAISSGVVTLTDLDFDERLSNGNPWLINIYTHYCPVTQELERAFEAVAEELMPDISLGRIDGAAQRGLMSRFQLRAYHGVYYLNGTETRAFCEGRDGNACEGKHISHQKLIKFAREGWKAAPPRTGCSSPISRCGRAVGQLTKLPAKARQTYHFLHDERHYSELTIFAGLLAVPVVMGLSFICFLDAYYSRRPLDAGFQHAHAE